MRPRGAQERPRAAQKTPRSGPETPKSEQEAAQSVQETPKMCPDGSQTSPKSTLARLMTHLARAFGRNLYTKGSRNKFLVEFCASRPSANLDFCCSCQCFVRVEAFTRITCKNMKKPRKIGLRGFQNAPWTFPEPSKIEPGALQETKNTAKTHQKWLKNA